MCGDNSYGQLGLGDVVLAKHIFLPTPVLLINDVLEDGDCVTDVSCGGGHTAAVTKSGCVLTWGRGDYGQLGIGRDWLLSVSEPGTLGLYVCVCVCVCVCVRVCVLHCGGANGSVGGGGGDNPRKHIASVKPSFKQVVSATRGVQGRCRRCGSGRVWGVPYGGGDGVRQVVHVGKGGLRHAWSAPWQR